MKKGLLQLTAVLSANIFLLCLFSVATAGTIGNPTAKVEQGGFQVGGEIDFAERDIEIESWGDFEAESKRYVVTGSYGISDWINVDAKLGLSKIEVKKTDFRCDDDLNFDGGNEVTFGTGLRATVHEVDDFRIGVVAQISYFKGGKDTLYEYEKMDTSSDSYREYEYESYDMELSWWEYEIAVGASYEGLGSFVPYGGIVLSEINGEAEDTHKEEEYEERRDSRDEWHIVDEESESNSEKFDCDEDSLLGIFLGANYDVIPELRVGLEARLINQTSFSFMVNYLF